MTGCGCCGSRTKPAKSAALNRGLAEARFDLVLTLDADSFLYRDALRNLVERYMSDPPQYARRGRYDARAQFPQELGDEGAGMGLLPRSSPR